MVGYVVRLASRRRYAGEPAPPLYRRIGDWEVVGGEVLSRRPLVRWRQLNYAVRRVEIAVVAVDDMVSRRRMADPERVHNVGDGFFGYGRGRETAHRVVRR